MSIVGAKIECALVCSTDVHFFFSFFLFSCFSLKKFFSYFFLKK